MKIDTSKIENFESLSAEEKLKALTEYEFDDNSEKLKILEEQNVKLKDASNRQSGEISKLKKDVQARMSEEERAKQAREEADKAKDELIAQLTREKDIATLAKGFGVAGELAPELATAFLDKDSSTFVDKFSKFIEAHDKARDAEALRNMSKPTGGNTGNDGITKEQFDKMGYAERLQLKNENPDAYDALVQQ